jgi:hypothetical protein
VQQLPKAVQSWVELRVDRLDPDPAAWVEQAGAVEDGELADIGGLVIVVPQQQEQVRGGQPFQEACLGHHGTLIASIGRGLA